MTEQAGYMNEPDLIDDVAAAICERGESTRKGYFRNILDTARDRDYGYAHLYAQEVAELRNQANEALIVLRKRGLLNLQGLELIKQSGEAKWQTNSKTF